MYFIEVSIQHFKFGKCITSMQLIVLLVRNPETWDCPVLSTLLPMWCTNRSICCDIRSVRCGTSQRPLAEEDQSDTLVWNVYWCPRSWTCRQRTWPCGRAPGPRRAEHAYGRADVCGVRRFASSRHRSSQLLWKSWSLSGSEWSHCQDTGSYWVASCAGVEWAMAALSHQQLQWKHMRAWLFPQRTLLLAHVSFPSYHTLHVVGCKVF